jgi:3-oxoacyl-[acyl-carrier protein] reductase
MDKLDDKVAIVTGAARGLGGAYAKRLAGLGAKVAVADQNLRAYEEFEAEARDMTGETTVAEIEAMGGIALGIEVDVADHEAVNAMVVQVVQECSRIDVLVANAGGGRGRLRYQGKHPRPGTAATRDRDELVGIGGYGQ